jgi:hypothetical protein
MPNPTSDPWIAVASLLLTGGGAKYAYDVVKDWRNRPPRELRIRTVVDASIATVARARDELEEDNARLRLTLAEERNQFNAERARYLADISRLEDQVRRERDEYALQASQAATRYNDLLEQIRHLKARPGPIGDTFA